MASSPKLILADEPSGSLDEKTSESIMKMLFDLVDRYESSLILVTHNENLASQCDHVYRLLNGLLVSEK